MTPTEIAKGVKRLRAGYNERDPALEMEIINALVQLVGEMASAISDSERAKFSYTLQHALTKAKPIDALAKERG